MPNLPPLPLHPVVASQLDVGMKALETLRDIQAVISHGTLEGPWLPEKTQAEIQAVLDLADVTY